MKTKIALAISSALAFSAVNAEQTEIITKEQVKTRSIQSHFKKNTNSKTGMPSQFDAEMKRTTFQWASIDDELPPIAPLDKQFRASAAADFYLNKLAGVTPAKSGLLNVSMVSMHNPEKGAKIAKYKQDILGVEIFNRELNIMMDSEHKLVASSGYLAIEPSANTSQLSAIAKQQFGSAEDAIKVAFNKMGGNSESLQLLVTKSDSPKYDHFVAESQVDKLQLKGEPRAKKVFFEANGTLIPAHYVEVETNHVDSVDSEYMSFVIDNKGKVLFKNNLISHASKFNYRAYLDADGKPWDSPHGNVIPAKPDSKPTDFITAKYLDAPLVELAHGPIKTNDPWLAEGATKVFGNNVRSYADVVAPDGFTNGDYTVEVTSANTFDYPYDTDSPEYSRKNREAAIVNLFVVNNYLHDDFYNHGFDEKAGNAQEVNYGRGGEEGDPLLVEVQDSSGFNNANMRTPADGHSPRMQMYLWDKAAVKGEDYGAYIKDDDKETLIQSVTLSALGPSAYEKVTAKLVRAEDAVETKNDGCTALTNADAIKGNIAIIDRGACNFVLKIEHAQAAGAIAVIVANNKDGDATLRMGGDNAEGITIPNIMISQNDGKNIYKMMADGDVIVSLFSKQKPRDFKASSWDNGIVAHEWGHYISNRLVGNGSGLSNNQGRSLGEGWGDFHALLLLTEASDAMIAGNEKFESAYAATSYVANFQRGIRRMPYSTNTEINNHTFKAIEGNPQVHASGEVWASMLWDSYVALINDERHSFKEAQSRMKDYLVAGYKMTPVSPTYTEARDALLAAAYANDIEDYKLILSAFAKRGMGLGAVSPSRFSRDHKGVVESTKTELSAFNVASHQFENDFEGLTNGYCTKDGVLDKGETGTVTFALKNSGNKSLEGLKAKVEVMSDHKVTFANEGKITFDKLDVFKSVTSSPLEFTLEEASAADEVKFKISFDEVEGVEVPEDYTISTTVNYGFKTKPLNGSSTSTDMESVTWEKDLTQKVLKGGERAESTYGAYDGGLIGLFSRGHDLGKQTIHLKNNGFESDVTVESKTFTVGYDGDFEFSFWHFYAIERGFDAGVVEISINGDDWVDAASVGGKFKYGYVGSVEKQDSQPLSERPVYHGRFIQNGNFGGVEVINFGEKLNGNEVKMRFRIATDGNTNDLGWWIDNIKVKNATTPIFNDIVAGNSFACDNRLPNVSIVADKTSVTEGEKVTLTATAIDANKDELTYSWKQLEGANAKLEGVDTNKLIITTADISSDEKQVFELTVSDGKGSVVSKSSIDVKAKAEPAPAPEPKKKSGGSLGIITLILLPLLGLRRKLK
ncbi:rhombosortase-dependent M36 family metallopeptidase [Parashewanella tropica]|uniref:rhombosortase-dependent M36 family metallopeptidase n=1 Tax=Parashewanella tropica TaxID=2547970 RepID=UPI0010594975|nr:rhombosortase-dependent M36 family metallopeptidase [Parashewanella tropica]